MNKLMSINNIGTFGSHWFILLLSFFVLFLISTLAPAQSLQGAIYDQNGQPVPGANIYIKNSGIGAASDVNGHYQIDLKPGKQTVVIRMMGFETVEKDVSACERKQLILDTTLSSSALQLGEAIISSNTRNLGKSIMHNVRTNRKKYLDATNHLQYSIYYRTALLNVEPKLLKDSIEAVKSDSLTKILQGEDTLLAKRKKNKNIFGKLFSDTTMISYIAELNETYAIVSSEGSAHYKEQVTAEKDYKIKMPIQYINVSVSDNPDGLQIDNMQDNYQNPYIFINNAASADFNFYLPQIRNNSLCEEPILSPLSATSALNYVFDYGGVIIIDSVKYYIINVTPLFSGDALYRGNIVVQDSTWALHSVNLSINPGALLFCKEFTINQTYKQISKGLYVPANTTFTYIMKEGKRIIHGSTNLINSNYIIPESFPNNTFNNEVKQYSTDAFDKDSVWWRTNRPIALNADEKKYDRKIDSLNKYYNSEEYMFKIDSMRNHVDFWNVVYKGVIFSSRKNQLVTYLNPLLMQFNIFGIGGYRHRLGGNIAKRFKNEYLLETEEMIDYGFQNNDVRGKVGLGLTYYPKRFVRTFVRFGDYYEMVNNNPSITSVFSRSNYARTQQLSISQRMEVINGLFAELTFIYSNQTSISNLKQDKWSDKIFGKLNTPINFEKYTKSELQLEMKYRINQKFVMKGKRKILMGSNWPDISFKYRKGIPQLFGSEVSFDYLELGVNGDMKLARLGSLGWQIQAGSFVNKNNLRMLEYKYFRGSDFFFFSNPLNSFQLLGPTISSSSSFVRGNYMHHFEGLAFNKIPFFNKLRLSPAVGSGFMLMDENNFRHIEFFAGIERVIRIRRQLFRLGLFAVTADNTLSKPTLTWKFGISTYDNFKRKWSY